MDKIIATIKAVSVKQKSDGQIGFLTFENPDWYNLTGEESALDELLKIIQKGNVVEFESDGVEHKNFKVKEMPKPEPRGQNSNWQEDIVNFEQLLNDAHQKFGDKFSIKTDLESVDYENKRAIFSACVSVENDDKVQVFTGFGDAEGIKTDLIKPHFIRMAETRAIARALRWATNNAQTAEEEK